MPTLTERTRNNVRAGVFVTVTLLAAFLVIVTLSGAWERLKPGRKYSMAFTVAEGVEGLSPGAEVRVGGLKRGAVERVTARLREAGNSDILVEIAIDSDVKLYKNARALRVMPVLGSVGWINFIDVGSAIAGELGPGDELKAFAPPGMLATLLGPDAASEADAIVKNTREFSEFLAHTVPREYEQRVVPMFEKTDAMLGDARDMVGSVKQDYGRWRVVVDEVVTRVNSAADHLDKLLAGGRSFIEDHRANFDRIVDNARDTSDDVKAVAHAVRTETIEKVHMLLDRGREGVDSFTATLKKAESWLDVQMPVISDAIADANLAATQLKLTMIEVRRAPWKVLYRPGVDELQHELLYDSARSFAVAAEELKFSSQSLDRLLAEHGDALKENKAAFEHMQQNLLRDFQNYEQAQQRLFDVLISDGP